MNSSTEPPSKLAQRVGPSVVDDVRSARQLLDEQSGHNIHRLAEHARRVSEEFRERKKAGKDLQAPGS